MKPALALLRYIPAVLCGLLLVAWLISVMSSSMMVVHLPDRDGLSQHVYLALGSGEIRLENMRFDPVTDHRIRLLFGGPVDGKFAGSRSVLGTFGCSYHFDELWMRLPIPVLLALLLPIAIGCLTHFRFPLWSYFAWTALVAVELAYYLRT